MDNIVKIKTNGTIKIIHPNEENTKDFCYNYTIKIDSTDLLLPLEIVVE